MTDTPNPNEVSDSSAETENTERMIPQSRFNEVNRKYKALEEQLKLLQEKQSADDSARQQQQQKELAEQNRYKELYEQALAQLEGLKAAQDEAKLYKDGFQATLNARLESVPEDKRHLIPELDPIKLSAWLDKALPDLMTPAKPAAPKLDGGSGSGGGVTNGGAVLNAAQQSLLDMARGMGYAVDETRAAQFAKNPTKQSDLNNKGDKS